MSHLLHPPLLEEMGLAAAVPWLVEGFQERSGIKVELDMPEDLGRLSQPVELTLFRVLQEGLTNIHRHANSPVAAIRLRREKDAVVLEIQDRGYGFAQKQGEVKKAGVGIAGMRERVSELGGEFQMISGKDGTTVRVSIPAPRNET